MILVLDNEVKPDYRYLAPEIVDFLPDAEYRVFVDDPTLPDLDQYDGIVLTGSTASVYDEEHADWVDTQSTLVRQCIDEGKPTLGVCFGHQLVNAALGGTVERDSRRATFVEMDHDGDDVLSDVNSVVPALHADIVTELGENMETTARTAYSDHFCTQHANAPLWTVQFHPEFTERVKDRPSDWSDGGYAFTDSNAVRVLENFAAVCESR